MSKIRMIAMVGGTLACVAGIGFYMQSGSAPKPKQVAPTKAESSIQETVMPLQPKVASMAAPLVLNDIVLTSVEPDLPKAVTLHQPKLIEPDVQDMVAPDDTLVLPATPEDPSAPELGCAISAKASPAPMASVKLSVTAPCSPNGRLTVHHSGMMFTTVTDESGKVQVVVPALSERSIFVVDFGHGKGAVVTASVPDLPNYDRVVVQWTGKTGFEIHAREFGASYGEQGHVWSGGDENVEGGSMIRLGTPDTLSPKLAEVYTFPTASTEKVGKVKLSIETEVTADNCGRDASAQTLELRSGRTLRTQDLTLAIPNCGAIGDFLVLNNLLEDLTIAAK